MPSSPSFLIVLTLLLVFLNTLSFKLNQNGDAVFSSLKVTSVDSDPASVVNNNKLDSEISNLSASIQAEMAKNMWALSSMRIHARKMVPSGPEQVHILQESSGGRRITLGVPQAVASNATARLFFKTETATSITSKTLLPTTLSTDVVTPSEISLLTIDVKPNLTPIQYLRVTEGITERYQFFDWPKTFANVPLGFYCPYNIGDTELISAIWAANLPTTTQAKIDCRNLNNAGEACDNVLGIAFDVASLTLDPEVIQIGQDTVNVVMNAEFTVVFPSAFPETPVVMIHNQETSGGGLTHCSYSVVTPTQFTAKCAYVPSSNVMERVNWLAVVPGTHYF